MAFALPSLAQVVVTGEVYDSISRKPLAGAAITLIRAGKPLAFPIRGGMGISR